MDAVDAEFSEVYVPFILLALGRSTRNVQGDGLPLLFLCNCVVAQSRLEILLQLTSLRVPHAWLDRSQGITFNIHADQGIKQTDPRIDVAQVIVADPQGLQLVHCAEGIRKRLYLVAVQIQPSQVRCPVHVLYALQLVEGQAEPVEFLRLWHGREVPSEAVLV